jgi:D-alanyl-lipoteichoic acid acyltransferase DltB (MBOAT superfamily)
MSFTDFLFPPFALLLVVCYYLTARRHRWIVLLLFSLVLYASWGLGLLPYPLLSMLVCWWGARLIQKRHDACDAEIAQAKERSASRDEQRAVRERDRRSCRRILLLVVLLVLGLLVYVKLPRELLWPADPAARPVELPGLPVLVFETGANAQPAASASLLFTLAAPLGISYYTMSLISYVADVYWRRDKAEANPARLALFALYLPKALEGPIVRHRDLAPQLAAGPKLDYRSLTRGAQRMCWGYLKKLVIADRLAPFVTAAFAGWEHQHGSILLLAAICGALQLYCDFSGCMDMALGLSEALDITMEENFRQPFWSLTVAEFWRRWHITLGAWFRDYVYMPLATSPTLIKLSGVLKKPFGAKVARAFTTVVSLMLTWLLTGLWHATGPSYLAWGIWWGLLITLSTVFAPQLKALREGLHIDDQSTGWKLYQRLRTFALFVVSRLLTIPGDLEVTRGVVERMGTAFGPWRLLDGSIFGFSFSWPSLVAMLVAIALLWYVDSREEAGVDVRDRVAELPLLPRWAIYLLLVFAPLIFGAYGTGYDAASFVYMAY